MVARTPQSMPGYDGLVYCVEHGKGGPRGWKCPLCPDMPKPEPAKQPAKPKRKRPGQEAEDALAQHLIEDGEYVVGDMGELLLWVEEGHDLDELIVTQYPWGLRDGRKWRADFAAPSHRLLIEVCGMAHAAGRSRVAKDIERDGAAARLGYRVLKVTPEQAKDGSAVGQIKEALAVEEASDE